jgi:hypothetical protein
MDFTASALIKKTGRETILRFIMEKYPKKAKIKYVV